MTDKGILKEHRQQIEKVVNYVFKNLDGDLSLNTLATVGNYSPYHFQKLFKQIIGESPKQYINKIRLETAAYYLAISKRSITEISIDCGFSSPAVFARAFRNYFQVSAEDMRTMDPMERLSVLKTPYAYQKLVQAGDEKTSNEKCDVALEIVIKRIPELWGICVNTSFEGPDEIQQALKDVMRLASSHDLRSAGSNMIGIMYPQHNIYRAFISIDRSTVLPRGIDKVEIKAGKYAAFKLRICSQQAVESISGFFDRFWLPENGYRMSEAYILEIFSESPNTKPYLNLEREICIPISPL